MAPSQKEHVRAFMQAKFGHTDGAQGLAGAGTVGRSGGMGGGTTFVGAGSANVHEANIDPVLSDVYPPGAGAGSMRSGGTAPSGGKQSSIGAGSNRVGSREPMQQSADNISDNQARKDQAGAGSRRSGGSGNPGGPDPGGFKGGKSALAGRGGHKLSKTMDEHVEVGTETSANKGAGIAHKYSQQMDIDDVGTNRAHVNEGRDRAMKVSRDTGGMHPMEHAGKMGKGRW